jgi:hypothetical protein
MATKPTVYPTWAESNVVDPTSGQNNVTTPPLDKQEFGWAFTEKPPRNWFNWLGRYTSLWIKWLAQQEAQSTTVNQANAATTPIVDIATGGMVIIYAVDTDTPANYFHGIAYVPPSPGAPVTVTIISNNVLTVSTISVTGVVTVAGSGGNYILNGQMKTVP